MSFKPGDKVVCVRGGGFRAHIKEGHTYTVKDFRLNKYIDLVLHDACHKEANINNSYICLNYGCCKGWNKSRFKLCEETNHPVATKHKCNCPMDILMGRGCICGGS